MKHRSLRFSVAVILALAVVGCSIKTRDQAKVWDVAIAKTLFAVQDGEQTVFEQHGITEAQHQAFNRALVPALEAGRTINLAVLAWKPGQAPPVEIGQAAKALKAASQLIEDTWPAAASTGVLGKILKAQGALTDLLLLIMGG